MKRRKLIMDVDPGHDDAIAIMTAARIPSLDIVGLTVVSGNSSLEQTVRNTLNICSKLDLDIPVYQGMDRPMIRERYLSSDSLGDVHGDSGLDGPVFGPPTKKLQPGHAVNFICDTIRQSPEKITLAASGPLSNLGMAIRLCPDILDNIAEIVLMGGSLGSGNVTPAAEFNILADPDAAHVVFSSGVPLTMMGLDVTRQALAYPEEVEQIRALGTVGSRFFCDLTDFFAKTQYEVFGWEAPPIHDLCNIVYLADPEIFDFIHCRIEADRQPGLNYGRTLGDVNHIYGTDSLTKAAIKLDRAKFWQVVREALAQYPPDKEA